MRRSSWLGWYTHWKRPDNTVWLPPTIHLEVTTGCNLTCLMCPRTFLSTHPAPQDPHRWNRNLSLKEYKTILSQFNNLHSIRLHGLGEPLMNPDLCKMISLASARGIDVDFTTNAVLLTPAITSDLINSGLKYLTVSIDGAIAKTYEKVRVGACFETVIENLHQLTQMKKMLNKKNPLLSINTVITNKNIMEIPEIIRLAKEVGAIEVRASPIEPFNKNMLSWLPDQSEWIHTAINAQKLARQIGIKFDDHGASRKSSYWKQGRNKTNRNTRCSRPWLVPFIRIDGYVCPCCNISDWQVLGGINVFKSDFRSIWNSEPFRQFRRQVKQGPLPPPCQNCPLA